MENSKNDLPEKKESLKESIENLDDRIKEGIQEGNKKVKETIGQGVKRTKSFLKKVLIGLALLAVVAGIGYILYANYTYSEGTRAGDLIKISKKGYVFKTYEGQLKLGGIDLSNPDEGLSDTWSFSVKNDAIFKQLERLQGEKVILRYREINQAMPWQGDTNYFIYAVEK